MSQSPVVVAVDFSPASLAALRWTADHVAGEAPLVGVHAVDLPEPPAFLAPLLAPAAPARELAIDGARQRFDTLAREVTHLEGEVRVGTPAKVLSDVARERKAGLVVVGPHGPRAGLGRLLGSTAEHAVRENECPVLIARGALERPPARVLVATDESRSGTAALEWAEAFALRGGHELIAFHCIDPAIAGAVSVAASPRERRHALQNLKAAGERWLDERLDASAVPAARSAGMIRFGDPVAEILAAVDAQDADLLVVGRGQPGLARALGSVADAMVRMAKVATVVVP